MGYYFKYVDKDEGKSLRFLSINFEKFAELLRIGLRMKNNRNLFKRKKV